MPFMPGKPTFEEFPNWAQENIGFDPNAKSLATWINSNVRIFLATLENHSFYARLQALVETHKANSRHNYINIITPKIELNIKSLGSILSKIYRLNVIENKNFPNPNGDTWVTDENVFRSLKDIIRTTIVCRHIDEPAKISALIGELCKELNLPCQINAQAKEHGYYAYHIYVCFTVELTRRDWETFEEEVQFEIQVTTEMQYMLYALTHIFYESEREKIEVNRDSWKWEYKSSKFSASYLSHSLHLLEGLLLRLYEDVSPGLPLLERQEAEQPTALSAAGPQAVVNDAAPEATDAVKS